MALQTAYQTFRRSPQSSSLAEDASLHYVTTLTSISSPADIAKHVASQAKVVKKTAENGLHAIEGSNALYLETETTLEFVSGGGAYLPDLDSNFLTDRTVTLPIMHVVHFNSAGQIKSIRLHWDQGALLKAVEVIGFRGKNWPIRDAADQIALITSSHEASRSSSTVDDQLAANMSQTSLNPRGRSPVKTAQDSHTAIFGHTEEPEVPTANGDRVAVRTSAKPPPRDFGDLFVNGEDPSTPVAASGIQRNGSPVKGAVAPKSGAGKNFAPSRVFDAEGADSSPTRGSSTGRSPEKGKKVEPRKYNHFEFADGHDEPAPQPAPPRPKTKHQSQWDFEDFSTPAKITTKPRAQDRRHFNLAGDDNEVHESPLKRPFPTAPQPRRDAETHFEFRDDGERSPDQQRRPGPPRGQGSIKARGQLYTSHVYADDNAEPGTAAVSNDENQRPTSSGITSLGDRAKTFGSQWEMSDEPQTSAATNKHGQSENQPPSAVTNLKGRHNDFDPHFVMADKSPAAHEGGLGERSDAANNRPQPTHQRRNQMMEAQWEASDHSPSAKRAASSMATSGAKHAPVSHSARDKENLGIKTGGDGMGGRKGAGRQWGIGDDGDAPSTKASSIIGGRRGQQPALQSDLWEF